MKAAPWALIAYATGCEFGALAMSFMTESLDYWNAYWEEIARHRDLAEGERQKKSRYYILVGCEDRFLDVSRLLCFGKRNARDCAYTISRTGHSAAGVCSWVAPFWNHPLNVPLWQPTPLPCRDNDHASFDRQRFVVDFPRKQLNRLLVHASGGFSLQSYQVHHDDVLRGFVHVAVGRRLTT